MEKTNETVFVTMKVGYDCETQVGSRWCIRCPSESVLCEDQPPFLLQM